MIKGGPKIIDDSLVLCLDAHDAKSYAGEPTTNFFYRETPRIDSSYSSFSYNSDSSWSANHPNAIIVYNTDGTDISSYVNTGANSGNWNVTSHAHWVYDNELKKPVVRMHSIPGYESQWRALHRNLYQNLSQLGLTAGDKFTISWLQKAYVTGVYARAGIYMRTTGGSNGFHAGQATSSDVGQLSNELGKWAHKSKTFTVPSGMNETGYNVGLYMYGHYTPTRDNTIYISDVQVEAGDYETPAVQGVSSSNSGLWGSRSATNGWVDRSGNSNDGTLVNGTDTGVSHYRDGEVIMPVSASYLDFDGSDDYIDGPIVAPNIGAFTYEAVIYRTSSDFLAVGNGTALGGGTYMQIFVYDAGMKVNLYAPQGLGGGWKTGNTIPNVSNTFVENNIYHVTVVNDGTVFYFYKNGVSLGSYDHSYLSNTGSTRLGILRNHVQSVGGTGRVYLARMYDKALTAAEVLSNYNATKNRFT